MGKTFDYNEFCSRLDKRGSENAISYYETFYDKDNPNSDERRGIILKLSRDYRMLGLKALPARHTDEAKENRALDEVVRFICVQIEILHLPDLVHEKGRSNSRSEAYRNPMIF